MCFYEENKEEENGMVNPPGEDTGTLAPTLHLTGGTGSRATEGTLCLHDSHCQKDSCRRP